MTALSAQEPSEWDDDPAWTHPMTAAELEAGLDRVCEHDEPPGPDEFEDVEPFSAAELAEIREAAIAELARRTPAPEDEEFTADELANALAESRPRGPNPGAQPQPPARP